jgi:hypothetical protein
VDNLGSQRGDRHSLQAAAPSVSGFLAAGTASPIARSPNGPALAEMGKDAMPSQLQPFIKQ